MSDNCFIFDENDKKWYLSLQKTGDLLPCNLLDSINIEAGEITKIPSSLLDTDNAVQRIMTGDRTDYTSQPERIQDQICTSEEWAIAARHGVKLSDASKEKIRKLRESND